MCSSSSNWTIRGSSVVTAQVLSVGEDLFSNLSIPIVIIFKHHLSTQEEILKADCKFVNERAE